MNCKCLAASGSLAVPSTQTHCRLTTGPHRCFAAVLPTRQSCRCFRRRCSVQVAAKQTSDKNDAESTTEKWGLEAGLFKVFTNKDDKSGKSKGQQTKELLTRYGSAYLITSISFSLVSFGLCYALVNSGVDVAALLQRFGLQSSGTSEKVGTVAIAYAAHKALSPVRFPPTVALTPVVAKAIGKKPKEDDKPQDL